MSKQIEALKKLHNSIHGQYYLGQDEERKLIDEILKQALEEDQSKREQAVTKLIQNSEELGGY